MRIIAGEGHGRKLKVPKGGETRSTASRVKQTYFDIMRPAIEGAHCRAQQAGVANSNLACVSAATRAAATLTKLWHPIRSIDMHRIVVRVFMEILLDAAGATYQRQKPDGQHCRRRHQAR